MKILSPKDRFNHLLEVSLLTSDRSHLEPPQWIYERGYYSGVNWYFHRLQNTRAGVGSLLFTDKEIPPFCEVSTWDISKQYVREYLEQEEQYRISKGIIARSYPSFYEQSLIKHSINR